MHSVLPRVRLGASILVDRIMSQPAIAAIVIWLNTGLPQLIQWCMS